MCENEAKNHEPKSDAKDGAARVGKIHSISIIGQIEGHYTLSDGQKSTKYEHIVPLLVEVDESDEIAAMLSQEGTARVTDAWKSINDFSLEDADATG